VDPGAFQERSPSMASSKEIQLGTGSESSGPSNFLLLSIISMPGRQPSDQRHKHPQVEITMKYASGVQVINALRTDNTDALTQGTYLRFCL